MPAVLPRGRVASWHVLCDFDHTITREDVTDGLLERFADPLWQWIESAWKEGRIDARGCMAAQVALLDVTPADLDAYLRTVAIDPEFFNFAGFCATAGVGLEIVSDGLDRSVHQVLARHGLDHLPVTANRLHMLGNGQWAVRFQHSGTGCRGRQGVCKCAVANQQPAGTRRLLIGDGQSDVCVASEVELVFAKDRLLAHCRAQGIRHVPIAGFADALHAMKRLVQTAASADFYLETLHA